MAQSGPAAASLEGVSVLRNRQRLLSAVNWQVQPGARWAVVGPNGAGKSTLLRLLNTELFPTTGTVTLFGQALGHVDVFSLRPRIGYSSRGLERRLPDRSSFTTTPVVRVIGTSPYAVEAFSPTANREFRAGLRLTGCPEIRVRGLPSGGDRESRAPEIRAKAMEAV